MNKIFMSVDVLNSSNNSVRSGVQSVVVLPGWGTCSLPTHFPGETHQQGQKGILQIAKYIYTTGRQFFNSCTGTSEEASKNYLYYLFFPDRKFIVWLLQDELIYLLRKLTYHIPELPAQAAHTLFNYLVCWFFLAVIMFVMY